MTGIIAPDRTEPRAPGQARQIKPGGFTHLLHAEWTKFRTVRGWVIAMILGATLIVGFGLLPGSQGSCGRSGPGSDCIPLVGPDGQEVTDSFYFVHQSLVGDGSLTVRVASLAGEQPPEPVSGGAADSEAAPGPTLSDLTPWAKAGLILKESTRPGSAYAAVMATGSHGVRMQYNYTHDRAGPAGNVSPASPRWLRLTRRGNTITGAASTDGTHWTTLGVAHLAGLATTVQAGLFTASPQHTQVVDQPFGRGAMSRPTRATARFDQLNREGSWPSPAWAAEEIGAPAGPAAEHVGELEQADGGFTVTGSGDIAPSVAGAAGIGTTVTQTLVGTFAGLILMIVVGAVFITTEYRRGLIRTTLAASPRRGRVLLAKALVLGAVTFLSGLVAAGLVVTLGPRVLRANGAYVHPATTLTQLRLVVGTAALLAVAAVLALAIGALLRRSAAAVAAVIAVIVVPYLLALTVLPIGAAQWLLRITPAAGFAIQQTAVRYPQVSNIYNPENGYFPLSGGAGFGVLCTWAALALGLAVIVFRRRDA